VSPSAPSQIETGKAQPSVSKLFDIVNLLNTSLDGLLAGASGPAGVLQVAGLGGPGDATPTWRRLTISAA
jgi:transcriptional regulator with XRE-family HTH domain